MTDQELKSSAAQSFLLETGYYGGSIDGLWGWESRQGARLWSDRDALPILGRLTSARRRFLDGKPSNEALRTLAAQFYLNDKGFYKGDLDGVWGPLSVTAARAWENRLIPVQGLTPYEVARHYIGTKEIPGRQHNPVIMNWYRRLLISFVADDETPWCSTLINFCALETQYERTGKLNARSWLAVGEPIALKDAREGDVVIFSRGVSNWEGHVAFFVRINRSQTIISHLGGNQSNSVSIADSDASQLLGVRRLRSLERLQGPTNRI